MTSTLRRCTNGVLLVSILLLPIVGTGCNIFSWTHDEGGSTEPDTLVDDARDALLDGKYSEALEYARKGIENDPAPMQYPELRWIAASAVLAESGVNMAQLMNALSNQGTALKAASPGSPRIADPYEILDLTTEELLALASSCPQALAFLVEVLDALENGDITAQDIIGLQFDIELGAGIAALMTAFLTTLDEDRDLTNGFVQDPNLEIWVDDNGGYEFVYNGDPNFLRDQIVCPQWPLFCESLQDINAAYATAILPETWGPVACDPDNGTVGPLPGTPDESYVIGQVLRFVRDGLFAIATDPDLACQ